LNGRRKSDEILWDGSLDEKKVFKPRHSNSAYPQKVTGKSLPGVIVICMNDSQSTHDDVLQKKVGKLLLRVCGNKIDKRVTRNNRVRGV
jgi:hypothetical protein